MTPRVALLTAALSVALGMWLMLPRSHSRGGVWALCSRRWVLGYLVRKSRG